MMKTSAVIVVLLLITGTQARSVVNKTVTFLQDFWKHFHEGAEEITEMVHGFYGSGLQQRLTEKQNETWQDLTALIEKYQSAMILWRKTSKEHLGDLPGKLHEEMIHLKDALQSLAVDLRAIHYQNAHRGNYSSLFNGLLHKNGADPETYPDYLLSHEHNQTYAKIGERLRVILTRLKPTGIKQGKEIQWRFQQILQKVVGKTNEMLEELKKFLSPQVVEIKRIISSHVDAISDVDHSMLD
ncbi:uncharacterized protein LOC103187699 [Callorhinchus milii]|uniref:uncharacterized protein LOC103187699 n=1 Tax=Callorhinchus milii TaxID=7868 RepID=UPI0004573F07|nr:uncharacterized protein LOC103187699 [Callorhinchus milii]|eukprot:gi/632977729/ref/XP_007905509.1/ PREDICTED: apolipoprotein A-IV-like [Callorhinchus milii]